MAPSKLIVIWGCENVVGSYIKSSLSSRTNWTVVQISNIEELEPAIQAAKTQPIEIILIHENDRSHMLETLEVCRNRPEIKVITINLDDNLLDIFNRRQLYVRQVADLLSAIDDHLDSVDYVDEVQ